MMKKYLLWLLLAAGNAVGFTLQSPAFDNHSTIPIKYTCDGQNISPPLAWIKPPHGTKSFVLIMEDPDAPNKTWDHWILFNIPANVKTLAENMQEPPGGTKLGMNSWQQVKYNGPCPPTGKHRYYFKLFALNILLDLKQGATKEEILSAMNKHILAASEWIGKYQKQP